MIVFIDHTYMHIPQRLNINEKTGFKELVNILREYKEYLENACIIHESLDALIALFDNVKRVDFSNNFGSKYFLSREEFFELVNSVSDYTFPKEPTLLEAWLMLIRKVYIDIHELYRYSLENSDIEETLSNVANLLSYFSCIQYEEDMSYEKTD